MKNYIWVSLVFGLIDIASDFIVWVHGPTLWALLFIQSYLKGCFCCSTISIFDHFNWNLYLSLPFYSFVTCNTLYLSCYWSYFCAQIISYGIPSFSILLKPPLDFILLHTQLLVYTSQPFVFLLVLFHLLPNIQFHIAMKVQLPCDKHAPSIQLAFNGDTLPFQLSSFCPPYNNPICDA